MKRRNITLRGQLLERTRTDFREMKKLLREKFINDEEALDRMLTHLLKSGFDVSDMKSYVQQAENHYRPAVEAFTFHNEHVIDQLFLSQGMYTGFVDTAADPNYALRHKGQTELILRRITPGDMLLMQAAQVHQTRENNMKPAMEQESYWQDIWMEVAMLLTDKQDRSDVGWLWDDLYAAAAFSMSFAQGSMRHNEMGAHYYEAFTKPDSPFYCGVVLAWESRREADGFKRGWQFNRVDPVERESLAMFSCVLTAYGIDNYARATADGERTVPFGHSFYTIYGSTLRAVKNKPAYFIGEPENGNQEADQRAEERHGFLGLRSHFY